MSDLREALKRLVAIYESEHDGDVVRPDWLKAALSAQPQPEAVEPFVQCADCAGTGLSTNRIGEPDICKACRGNTVVPSQPEAALADWRDDPTSDERWSAGLDFAMIQLCAVLGVDPHDVTWDAATEEVEGDVRAVIGNILRAKLGDDWSPRTATPQPEAAEPVATDVGRYAKLVSTLTRWRDYNDANSIELTRGDIIALLNGIRDDQSYADLRASGGIVTTPPLATERMRAHSGRLQEKDRNPTDTKMSGEMTDLEIFAQELQKAITRDPWINHRDRICFAIEAALQKTLSRRALSERKDG